ncbi:MAG TPA: hypothetical protein VFU99_10870 [Gaiellaceae bacterium]|nr:hypothetical protein [Gaiellaceae bacterium]
MRKFFVVLIAVAALALTGLASATGAQGVYGTGIQRFDVPSVNVQGSFTLSLSATTLPSGAVVGHHNVVLQYKSPQVSFGMLQAKPIYVETDGPIACVVSEVTMLIDWPSPPSFQPVMTVARIVDVPGGPDIFGSSNYSSPQDPEAACSAGATSPITDGNFTINP